MWNLPRPGIEAVSPALAGGFVTTGIPGKSSLTFGGRDIRAQSSVRLRAVRGAFPAAVALEIMEKEASFLPEC